MEWTHRIYGKHPEHTKGRFKAMDTNNGSLAGNLIYATMFDLETAKKVASGLNKQNSSDNWIFESRKI